eukprot:g3138.t1
MRAVEQLRAQLYPEVVVLPGLADPAFAGSVTDALIEQHPPKKLKRLLSAPKRLKAAVVEVLTAKANAGQRGAGGIAKPKSGAPKPLEPERDHTALGMAAHDNDLSRIDQLLARGADPNLGNDRGVTALHRAARQGHLSAVSVLLAHGADRLRTSANGKTASDLARERGHAAVVALLAQDTPGGQGAGPVVVEEQAGGGADEPSGEVGGEAKPSARQGLAATKPPSPRRKLKPATPQVFTMTRRFTRRVKRVYVGDGDDEWDECAECRSTEQLEADPQQQGVFYCKDCWEAYWAGWAGAAAEETKQELFCQESKHPDPQPGPAAGTRHAGASAGTVAEQAQWERELALPPPAGEPELGGLGGPGAARPPWSRNEVGPHVMGQLVRVMQGVIGGSFGSAFGARQIEEALQAASSEVQQAAVALFGCDGDEHEGVPETAAAGRGAESGHSAENGGRCERGTARAEHQAGMSRLAGASAPMSDAWSRVARLPSLAAQRAEARARAWREAAEQARAERDAERKSKEAREVAAALRQVADMEKSEARERAQAERRALVAELRAAEEDVRRTEERERALKARYKAARAAVAREKAEAAQLVIRAAEQEAQRAGGAGGPEGGTKAVREEVETRERAEAEGAVQRVTEFEKSEALARRLAKDPEAPEEPGGACTLRSQATAARKPQPLAEPTAPPSVPVVLSGRDNRRRAAQLRAVVDALLEGARRYHDWPPHIRMLPTGKVVLKWRQTGQVQSVDCQLVNPLMAYTPCGLLGPAKAARAKVARFEASQKEGGDKGTQVIEQARAHKSYDVKVNVRFHATKVTSPVKVELFCRDCKRSKTFSWREWTRGGSQLAETKAALAAMAGWCHPEWQQRDVLFQYAQLRSSKFCPHVQPTKSEKRTEMAGAAAERATPGSLAPGSVLELQQRHEVYARWLKYEDGLNGGGKRRTTKKAEQLDALRKGLDLRVDGTDVRGRVARARIRGQQHCKTWHKGHRGERGYKLDGDRRWNTLSLPVLSPEGLVLGVQCLMGKEAREQQHKRYHTVPLKPIEDGLSPLPCWLPCELLELRRGETDGGRGGYLGDRPLIGFCEAVLKPAVAAWWLAVPFIGTATLNRSGGYDLLAAGPAVSGQRDRATGYVCRVERQCGWGGDPELEAEFVIFPDAGSLVKEQVLAAYLHVIVAMVALDPLREVAVAWWGQDTEEEGLEREQSGSGAGVDNSACEGDSEAEGAGASSGPNAAAAFPTMLRPAERRRGRATKHDPAGLRLLDIDDYVTRHVDFDAVVRDADCDGSADIIDRRREARAPDWYDAKRELRRIRRLPVSQYLRMVHSGAQRHCLERGDVQSLLKGGQCLHRAKGAVPSTWAQLVQAFEELEALHGDQRRQRRAEWQQGPQPGTGQVGAPEGGGHGHGGGEERGAAPPPPALPPTMPTRLPPSLLVEGQGDEMAATLVITPPALLAHARPMPRYGEVRGVRFGIAALQGVPGGLLGACEVRFVWGLSETCSAALLALLRWMRESFDVWSARLQKQKQGAAAPAVAELYLPASLTVQRRRAIQAELQELPLLRARSVGVGPGKRRLTLQLREGEDS